MKTKVRLVLERDTLIEEFDLLGDNDKILISFCEDGVEDILGKIPSTENLIIMDCELSFGEWKHE